MTTPTERTIEGFRSLAGATEPTLVHGSDSAASAVREIASGGRVEGGRTTNVM